MLDKYAKRLEPHIDRLIANMGEKTALRDACAYALDGGKRIRPALVYMTADALGQDASNGALCVELMHASSLIADDLPCMDDDDLRRGKPTVHRAFDEAIALLASYALIAAGYGLIADNALAVKQVSKQGGILGLVGGQYLDINPPAQDFATLKEVVSKKTGALFQASLVLGWIYGGGDATRLPEVEKTGDHLGMVFQLLDDLDDLEQDRKGGNVMNAFLMLGEAEARELLAKELISLHEGLTSLDLLTGDFAKLLELFQR